MNIFDPSQTRPPLNADEPHESQIRRARELSNRSIARKNLVGVGASLADDYVGIIGDGTFVSSRAEYLRLFKAGFDRPKDCMTYVRTPDSIHIADDQLLAAENGNWTAMLPNGHIAFTGSYAAMWRRSESGWKIRSEIFVTLQG